MNQIPEITRSLYQPETDINYTLLSGENALHIASTCNYIELAELLIHHQININKQDIFGKTPLMRASLSGNIEIVKILLNQSNIAINEQDRYGNTAAILGLLQTKIFIKHFTTL